jgi:ABC-2 type transport system ATP-binding protein
MDIMSGASDPGPLAGSTPGSSAGSDPGSSAGSTPGPLAIEVRDLSFRYPGSSKPIFEGLQLDVHPGMRFGLFGPNGAGKTTLMSLMTGLLKPSEGTIRLFGMDLHTRDKAGHALFGFVPQDFSFYEELTPMQNLAFFGAWSGLTGAQTRKRSLFLLDILGLSDFRDQRAEIFSGGMKRRLNLAIGVIHSPRILFLDEPTVGVDVQTGYAILRYLRALNEEGTTLVYTSHQLGEAESLCQEIALIDQGFIIAEGSLTELLSGHQQDDLQGLFLELTGKTYRDA